MERGILIAIEGVEGSGRSTHLQGVKKYLEEEGYGVTIIGLQSSQLLGAKLSQVKRDLVFQRITLFLAYATDLADQIEYTVKEALNSGFVVLADGYVYTLMAWGLTRGLDKNWINDVLSFALKPDLAIALVAPVSTISRRVIMKNGKIDPLTSSIDLCINKDLYTSFRYHVRTFQRYLLEISREYDLKVVRTNRNYEEVHKEIINYVRGELK
ncbi:dTMP kinase [Stygiolobus caldivivus]|uniref:Probable thymidylate kinase n=1 Tax=Stygiolobus caldivivus TaxID=2824673 RepID=A0A8D5ZHX1_9CREN|nr:thymidylate kinase [Stygiolobus caldivivus]BCU69091.1 thymidylate kinase [Stygiolobus caldivivus]